MARIILIDDDTNIQLSLRMALENEGHQVDTCKDGVEGLEAINTICPDAAIVDIKMPRMNGLDLLKNVRKNSDMPIILLTSKDEEIDELLGLRSGADDYITKPFSVRLVVERVRVILRHAKARSNSGNESDDGNAKDITVGPLILSPDKHLCCWRQHTVNLSTTEFLLLFSLARSPSTLRERDTLLNEAYGENVYVDDRTIDSHIRRIRRKFRAVDPDFNSIETVYGGGYRFVLP